jgi:CHAT domain-containing protein
VFNSYGGAYSRRNNSGDREKAVEQFNKALAILDSLDAPYRTVDTLFNLARTQRDLGLLVEAKVSIEEAINLLETIRSNASIKEIRQSYFAKKHFYYDFYIALLMDLKKKGSGEDYEAQALWASECARSRTLLDLLVENQGQIDQGLPREAINSIEHARQRLADAYKNRRRALNEGEKHKVDLAENTLRDAISESRDIERRFNGANAGLLIQSQRVSEIQRTLDDETAYVEYNLGEQNSFIWVLRKDGLTSVEIPYGASAIGSAVDQLVAAVTERSCRKRNEPDSQREKRIQRGDASWPRLAAHLSEMLLKPISAQLRTQRLIIIADRKLQLLPFALLPMPTNADGTNESESAVRLLIQDHEVAYTPSIAVLREVRIRTSERATPPKAIAILADPVFESDDPRVKSRAAKTTSGRPNSQGVMNGLVAARRARELTRSVNCEQDVARFGRLPGTLAEAEGIIKALDPRIESFVAVNFDASLPTLKRDDLNQYKVLHLATHAYVPSSAPEQASVILSLVDKNGQLQTGYIGLELKLHADLVTLSACETGIGRDIEGEGVVGLARGFMYAGVPRVVASQWKVQDAPTARLMRSFYAAMFNDGLSTSAALRKAQLDMYERAPTIERRQPYFWAAFMLQGEWR